MDKILALSIAGAVCFMASTTASAQPTWSIVESKSPTDDSPQVAPGWLLGTPHLSYGAESKRWKRPFRRKTLIWVTNP